MTAVRRPIRVGLAQFALIAVCLGGPQARSAEADRPPDRADAADTRFLLSPGHAEVPSAASSGWRLSLEAITLTRSNGDVNQPLINRLPGDRTTFGETAFLPGTPAFNSNQFQQGFGTGPKVALTYEDDRGWGLEFAYFNVLNLNASKTIGPESPLNWYVMRSPGAAPNFWQTQDFPDQGMTWNSMSTIHSAEASARARIRKDLHLIAGLRWIQLNDSLVGMTSPADRNVPAWKLGSCGSPVDVTLVAINQCTNASGASVSGYPPFWTTSTTNNLFGVQVGAEGVLFESGALSLAGSLKAGFYNNHASQNDWVSMSKVMYTTGASKNGFAFSGEGTLQLRYRVSEDLTVKAGYVLLWLNQVALAPGQISQTYAGSSTSITATGVNTGSSVLFQGGTLGIEYTF